MQPFTYVAIYFVVWWTVLFAVLPFGVRGQHEDGEVTDGTDPGAPIKAHLWQKALATTLISAVLTVLIFWGMTSPWLQEYWS
jgi:predicted secreted protein